MALTRLSISIDDTMWPKLHIAGERLHSDGSRSVFDERQQYDLAYGAFENLLHNQLRPLVEDLLKRRNR